MVGQCCRFAFLCLLCSIWRIALSWESCLERAWPSRQGACGGKNSRRCLKAPANDQAKLLNQQKNCFLQTQRHWGWGCTRQLGQSNSLLRPKVSILCAASKSCECQSSSSWARAKGSGKYCQNKEVSLAFGATTSSNFSGIFSLWWACCNLKSTRCCWTETKKKCENGYLL